LCCLAEQTSQKERSSDLEAPNFEDMSVTLLADLQTRQSAEKDHIESTMLDVVSVLSL